MAWRGGDRKPARLDTPQAPVQTRRHGPRARAMNDTHENIKYLVTDLPQFPEPDLAGISRRLFGVEGDYRFLDSDRDQNFLLAAGERRWVLKFHHPEEDEAVVAFQNAALEHIAVTAPDILVPEVVRTRAGEPFGRAVAPDGRESIVRLLTWVPGKSLDEIGTSRRQRHGVGALVARLDLALQGFFHPAAVHTLLWDIRQAPKLRVHTGDIRAKSDRGLAEWALDRFIEHVLPRWTRFRSQVIHNDANRCNVVADEDDPDRPNGIIDFGDMMFGPIATEVALACDHYALDADDPMEHFIDVACGFDSVLPLREDEVDALFDMIVARLAIGAVIVTRRAVARLGSPPYLPGYDTQVFRALDTLRSLGPESGTGMFRDALRIPARCPKGTVATPESQSLGEQLDRRRTYLGRHLSLFYRKPLHLERGEGAMLYDANGRAFVDAYNNVASVGHCHPHVVNAVSRQAAALGTNTRYVYRILADYAERLQATMPEHLTSCIMVNSGSEANDVAWRIATLLTGKRGGIVMEDAYHGITEAVSHLSPQETGEEAPHVRTLMSPDPYRGPYGPDDADMAERYAADADRAIAELDGAGYGTACFMVDTSFCSNGIPDVPAGYLQGVAARVRAAGGMVIADEVQYGFGRPGTHMWGFQHHATDPDIVTIGKPVGDGFPLGVVVTTAAILEEFSRASGMFSTFGGNPVACAAGIAVLDVLERENLLENALVTGACMKSGLEGLMTRHEMIGDVRGQGFIAGVEIVRNRETKEPDPERMAAVQNRMRELGVLVGREGRFDNVFKIRPPMVFSRDNVDSLVSAMDRAMSELEGNRDSA